MLTKNSGQPSAFKRFLESDLMWKFLHSPAAIISFVICAGLLLSAFFASWIAPYDPFDLTSFDLSDAFLPPAWMEGGKWQFLLEDQEEGTKNVLFCSVLMSWNTIFSLASLIMLSTSTTGACSYALSIKSHAAISVSSRSPQS